MIPQARLRRNVTGGHSLRARRCWGSQHHVYQGMQEGCAPSCWRAVRSVDALLPNTQMPLHLIIHDAHKTLAHTHRKVSYTLDQHRSKGC